MPHLKSRELSSIIVHGLALRSYATLDNALAQPHLFHL